jgi:hypothetical protein
MQHAMDVRYFAYTAWGTRALARGEKEDKKSRVRTRKAGTHNGNGDGWMDERCGE